MRDEEFRAWLEARRWNGKKLTSVSNRMSKARRFERSMPALGLGAADLDTAFDADGMEQVTERLRAWCRAAAATGTAPPELVGESTNAASMIANVAAAVRNYRQFREGAGSPAAAWPALEELRDIFLDRVPEFERFDHTDNAYERIERVYKDAMMAEVRGIAASNEHDEAAGRRIFRALMPNSGPLLRWQTDDDFARKFPALAPAFYAAIGRLARDTGPVADAIMAAADTFARLRAEGATTLTFGEIVSVAFSVAGMARPTEAVPFKISKAQTLARLLTGDPIFSGSTLERGQVERWLDFLRRIEAVMRDEWHWHPRDLLDVQGFAWTALDDKWKVEDAPADDTPIWIVAARDGATDGLAGFVERGEWRLSDGGRARLADAVRQMRPGDRIVLRDYLPPSRDLPFATPGKAVSGLRIRATGTIRDNRDDGRSVGVDWQVLPEPRLWYFYTLMDPIWRLRPEESDYARRFAAFLFDGEAQDYDWFAAHWFGEHDDEGKPVPPDPTNLILYGPPGTGKTYATRARAVALADGQATGDRAAIRARYDALVAAGQVRFVTFHQSYAYEDFVEGLRPTTGADGGETAGVGFRLEPVPGIFREIASFAEQAMKSADAGAPFDMAGRQVFKMSLGRAGSEDAIFDAAIEGEYVVLGWGGDVDWTPYGDYEAIRARWNEDHPGTNGNDSNILQTTRFRADMRIGDLVVVSYGNTRFRAIGEITGDYEYAPTEVRDYNHRRRVRWLFVPPEPLPIGFYAKPFTMRSCYLLREDSLNRDALALLLPGSGGGQASAPRQFVLVIDEINRGNISKVFGELITLIERDKRLGMDEAMRLRLPYSKQDFGVPANLHIIGTMNTADRSIALLDTALRRRFTFEELMPDPSVLAPVDGIDLPALLTTLNDRIEYLFDREHGIGHAYFLPCRSRGDVDAVMRHKVIPLLAEYFYEDWTKVAAVLGDVFEDDGKRRDGGFFVREPLASPFAQSGEEESTRYRWTVKSPEAFVYEQAVRHQAGPA